MINSLLVGPKEQQERLNICKSCDKFKPKTSVLPSRCGECGCILYIKAKFKAQHCPLENPKW